VIGKDKNPLGEPAKPKPAPVQPAYNPTPGYGYYCGGAAAVGGLVGGLGQGLGRVQVQPGYGGGMPQYGGNPYAAMGGMYGGMGGAYGGMGGAYGGRRW
jgi:hypothetical protein